MSYSGQIVERKEGEEIEEADKSALNTTARALVNIDEEVFELFVKMDNLKLKRETLIKKYNEIKDFFIQNNRKSLLAKAYVSPAAPYDESVVSKKEKAVLSDYNNHWNDKINDVQKLIKIKQTLKFGNDFTPERHLRDNNYVYFFMSELRTKADYEFESSQDENNSKEQREVHFKNYKDIRRDLKALTNFHKEQ